MHTCPEARPELPMNITVMSNSFGNFMFIWNRTWNVALKHWTAFMCATLKVCLCLHCCPILSMETVISQHIFLLTSRGQQWLIHYSYTTVHMNIQSHYRPTLLTRFTLRRHTVLIKYIYRLICLIWSHFPKPRCLKKGIVVLCGFTFKISYNKHIYHRTFSPTTP